MATSIKAPRRISDPACISNGYLGTASKMKLTIMKKFCPHDSDHESQSGGREPEAEQAGQTTPVRKDGGAASETPGLPGLKSAFKKLNASTIELAATADMGDSLMGELGRQGEMMDPLTAFITSEANASLESSVVTVVGHERALGIFKDSLPADDPYSGLNWQRSAQGSQVLYVAPRAHGTTHADRCKPMYAHGVEVMRSEPAGEGEQHQSVLVAQKFIDRAPTIYYCVNSRYVHPWNNSDEPFSFLNKEFHPKKDPSKTWDQDVGKIGREDVRAFGKYHVDLASLRQVAQNHLPALVYADRVDSSFLE
eukprot:SAG11_NODE_304_length_10999_cov_3.121376_4_plen_309_part_00